MNFELENLFRFQLLINDMQQTILDAKKREAKPEIIEAMTGRVDKLIEIYKTFETYYYNSHFAHQKVLSLEFENQSLRNAILTMKDEHEKLLKSIEWK